MKRHGRAHTGERVHLPRVAELLLERRGGGRLQELAEPRTGIREPPARQLDPEGVERTEDTIVYSSHRCSLPC
jgi:hypothetical protein